MQDLETDWTGTHAVRVYTLDGLKDGTCHVPEDGNAMVRTLDGTVSMEVRRTWVLYKLEAGLEFYNC